ncbi:hypothetical protein [Acinetobacter chengduensis]|uniref:Uncharacterized protein n=1 Tax=Acinetobacter chengduensis TaxID=2420890 RepID=A0ABX9TSL2_9GAMM|nr:hypothetical protein [Acinetobacter chengduensis]RLL18992.1 hypothetical protein D9K81_14640 [Acinetobacter chengduensis]
MKYLLNETEIKEIIEHWLNTPANSIRGSGYGERTNRILFNEMSMDVADFILDKIKQDIPLFASLSSDELQVLSEDLGHDKKRIYISIGTVVVPISPEESNTNYTGDSANAYAQ